jgi:fructokinase
MSKTFAGIEAGGTKFVCIVGSGPKDIRKKVSFPTTQPEETLSQTIDFLRSLPYDLAAVGIASFGPIDVRRDSPTYGYITTTPKPGWANFDFCGALRAAFDLPIGFDTDVNGAALGEQRWGAAHRLDTFVYLTIGTGIGGGGLVNGRLMHGMLHPEMGHMFVPHNRQADPFTGICPYHSDCFEGLASGPAIERRWRQRAEYLPSDHPAWDLEAHYLALGLVNLITTLSPQRIILGGGVMQHPHIFSLLRPKVQALLNYYVQSPEILDHIDEYIVPPALGSLAGSLGAIALAENALNQPAT